jgi:hypothetical protein
MLLKLFEELIMPAFLPIDIFSRLCKLSLEVFCLFAFIPNFLSSGVFSPTADSNSDNDVESSVHQDEDIVYNLSLKF